MVTLANRVKHTISAVASSGTGTLTLGAASTGYQGLADAAGVADGATLRYTIENATGGGWELGSGVYTASGTTLTRTPSESSNSGNAITATTDSTVFITASAADIGDMAWQSAWPSDPSSNNIAIGSTALASLQSGGTGNVAVGPEAGDSITTGDYNVCVGYKSGEALATNTGTVAIGYYTLEASAGDGQVAIGYGAAKSSTGVYNISIGYDSMGNSSGSSVSGSNCIAIGYQAGYNGGSSANQISIGTRTNRGVGGGTGRVSIGTDAGHNGTGTYCTAVGHNAGYRWSSGANNTALGYNAAGTTQSGFFTGTNNTLLGYQATAPAGSSSNQFVLGNSSVSALYCQDSSISAASDERDKTAIKDIAWGLDFIKDVRPVSFTWNRRDGAQGTRRQVGFIAQELYDVELKHSSTKTTGIVDFTNPDSLSVAPAKMLPMAIKAIQQLSNKIDVLEARLAKLET